MVKILGINGFVFMYIHNAINSDNSVLEQKKNSLMSVIYKLC